MSSVSWARAPTRRASAETAAAPPVRRSARLVRRSRSARSDWTAAGPPATRARTRSTAAPPSTIRSRRISRACRLACSAAARSSASARSAPASRNSRSVAVRSGCGRSCHSRAWARRTPRYSSLGGRPRESQASAVAERWCRIRWPSTSSSSQPRSRGQARASASWAISTTPSSLVTSRVATSRSTSSSWAGSGDDLAARQPGSDRFAFGAGGDEAEQEVVQGAPLVGVELAVQGLGGLRDRSADPAGGLVAGDGEGAALHGAARSRAGRGRAAGGRRARSRPRGRAGRPVRARR